MCPRYARLRDLQWYSFEEIAETSGPASRSGWHVFLCQAGRTKMMSFPMVSRDHWEYHTVPASIPPTARSLFYDSDPDSRRSLWS
jgi:hypothetical protein